MYVMSLSPHAVSPGFLILDSDLSSARCWYRSIFKHRSINMFDDFGLYLYDTCANVEGSSHYVNI